MAHNLRTCAKMILNLERGYVIKPLHFFILAKGGKGGKMILNLEHISQKDTYRNAAKMPT